MIKKRGQISIFLVLGVVLLLLGATYFYFQEVSNNRQITLADPLAKEAKNFIEACVQSVSDKAFRILGVNGGYITFPGEIQNDPRTYLQPGPITEIKNPYWWFDGKENIPTEEFMTAQVEEYLKTNLDNCITELNSFRNLELKKLDTIEAAVQINQRDVTVNVEYPVELAIGENRSKIKLRDFQATLPIRFKEIFAIAKDIMNAENTEFFFEKKTIDLISMDTEIPTTDIEVHCGEKVWMQKNIEEKLKKLLQVNLPYTNIVGSEFATTGYVSNPFGEDTYADSYFNTHYTWQVADRHLEDLKVAVEFDSRWPFQLYVRPSENGILRSGAEQSQDILKFLCINVWHFTYDVTYPVKITLTDQTGIDPYQFSFAFKVNVDHNTPKRENFAFKMFDTKDVGSKESYCNDRVHEMTIYTIENSSRAADVPHVNLTYTCGIYECDIGETDWLSFGAAAGLRETFPFCNNGILRAKADGYLDGMMFVQSDKPSLQTMYLTPSKEFTEFTVVKHDVDNPLLENPLEEGDSVSISLTTVDNGFDTFSVYPAGRGIPLTLLRKDKTYEVSLFLTNGDEISGGYEGTWSITRDEIEEADLIKFHVIENKATEAEQILFFGNLATHSRNVPEPELI